MDSRDREVSAPKRGRALIASVFIAVSVVASSGALHRLSGPALAAAPPPSNGDTSGGGNVIVRNKDIPPKFTKPITISEPTVSKVPHFTIIVVPPSRSASKTSITSGDVVHITANKKTGTFTIQVLTPKGGRLTSWTQPLEIVPPKSTVKGKVWALQMLTSKGWVTLPTKNGEVGVTKADVYRWVLAPAPTPTKKPKP